MQKFSLRESKGAVLPVLILLITEMRPVSVRYMELETDYSKKTIQKALDFLQSKQAVMPVGKLYQFCGDGGQLPLYWGEITEPNNPSPALDQPGLPGLEDENENFSRQFCGFEILPPITEKFHNEEKISQNGKISQLEARISALETEMAAMKMEKNAENFPKMEKISKNCTNLEKNAEKISENGNFSDLKLSLTRTSINTDKDNLLLVNTETEKISESEEISENPAKTIGQQHDDDYYINMLHQIDDFYRQNQALWKEGFENYSPLPDDCSEWEKVVAKTHPDIRLLEFILTRTVDLRTFENWCSLSYKDAKNNLLCRIGIYGKHFNPIINDDDITLEMIDYHYQKFKIEQPTHPKITLGAVGYRIEHKFDNEESRESLPLVYGWIEDK